MDYDTAKAADGADHALRTPAYMHTTDQSSSLAMLRNVAMKKREAHEVGAGNGNGSTGAIPATAEQPPQRSMLAPVNVQTGQFARLRTRSAGGVQEDLLPSAVGDSSGSSDEDAAARPAGVPRARNPLGWRRSRRPSSPARTPAVRAASPWARPQPAARSHGGVLASAPEVVIARGLRAQQEAVLDLKAQEAAAHEMLEQAMRTSQQPSTAYKTRCEAFEQQRSAARQPMPRIGPRQEHQEHQERSTKQASRAGAGIPCRPSNGQSQRPPGQQPIQPPAPPDRRPPATPAATVSALPPRDTAERCAGAKSSHRSGGASELLKQREAANGLPSALYTLRSRLHEQASAQTNGFSNNVEVASIAAARPLTAGAAPLTVRVGPYPSTAVETGVEAAACGAPQAHGMVQHAVGEDARSDRPLQLAVAKADAAVAKAELDEDPRDALQLLLNSLERQQSCEDEAGGSCTACEGSA
eukprot:7113695-Prymnesium_polylepis.2